MCGIGFSLTWCHHANETHQNSSSSSSTSSSTKSFLLEQRIQNNLSFRGPDLPFSKKTFEYSTSMSSTNYNDKHPSTRGDDDDDQKARLQGDNDTSASSNVMTKPYCCTMIMRFNLFASVLHMQGNEMIKQPLEYTYSATTFGNTCSKETNGISFNHYLSFCWNGEAYCIQTPSSVQTKNDNNDDNDDDEIHNSNDDFVNHSPYFDILTKKKENDQSDTKIVLEYIAKNVFHSNSANCNSSSNSSTCGVTENDMNTQQQQPQQYYDDHHTKLANILSHVHGEYSFILHHHNEKNHNDNKNDDKNKRNDDKGCIYFGRDPLGRRSLLMSKIKCDERDVITVPFFSQQQNNAQQQQFVVSSVGLDCDLQSLDTTIDPDNSNPNNMEMEEIPAGRVYCLNLNDGTLSFQTIPKRIQHSNQNNLQQPMNEMKILSLEQASDKLHQYLNQAIRRRIIDAPITIPTSKLGQSETSNTPMNPKDGTNDEASVAILFSGGVDSVVLAALCHDHIPINQPIDLINVAFANNINSIGNTKTKNNDSKDDESAFEASPDRQAALLSYQEMKIRWPNRNWRFIAVNVPYDEVLEYEKTICGLISPLTSTMDFNIGTAFWFATRGCGIQRELIMKDNNHNNDKVMNQMKKSTHLRFSDETCIMTKPKVKKICSKDGCEKIAQHGCIFGACKFCCGVYQRPISQYLGGRAALCLIHHSKQKRKNKSTKQKLLTTDEKESKSDKHQLQPSAFSSLKKRIISKAKVILIGIGADEQMAGYGRHRTTYNKGGYDALRKELVMEKNRLWTRNLGRDDRCVSFHGKEARFPFLDEDVVDFLNELDVEQFCDMTRPPGEGDKLILRLIAKKIGVTQCSGLVKRAIQFGSRIAKVSDTHRFGSSSKANGTASYRR